MARSKRLVDPEEFEPTQDDLDFQTFMDTMGGSASVIEVWRCHRDGRRGYIERLSIDAFREAPLDYLRERYGPGKYQLTLKDSKGKHAGNKTVEIDPLTIPVNGSTPANGDGRNNFDQKHIELLREQAERQQTLMMTILAGNKGPDLGTLMTGMAAMMGATKPPAHDPTAMLAACVQMFATMKGPAKDEDWLTRAKTIIELAKDLQPNDKEENMWTVVKEVGKEVVTRLQLPGTVAVEPAGVPATLAPVIYTPPTSTSAPGGQVTVTSVKSAGAGWGKPLGTDPPAAAQPPVQAAPNRVDWIKAALAYLKDKARRGRDPKLVLDWIMENPEEAQWAALLQVIQEGATFEHLLAFDAEIANEPVLANWFRALYHDIHGELHQPVDTAGTGGNPNNPGDHAGPGAAGPVAAGSPAAGGNAGPSPGD